MNPMKVTFFLVTLVFVALDIITGWTKALSTGTTNSTIMRVGLFHKLGEILAVAVGYICEYTFPLVGITVNLPLVESICTYIILMELASVIENIMKINPQLADVLNRVFKRGDTNEKR